MRVFRNATHFIAPALLVGLTNFHSCPAQSPSGQGTNAPAGSKVTNAAYPQPPKSGAAKTLLDIVLEKKTSTGTEQMRQEHVFDPGDIIRFRLASRYNGYMYVMDQGTSGKFSTVFPSVETGSDNRLTAGSDYLVPTSSDGWFKIEGPAGFDVLYFLLSPVAIAPPSSATGRNQSSTAPGPLSSLKPRCNDAIFKARGECMDSSAGPSALPPDAVLPAPMRPMAGSASRDLIFTRDGDETTVASNAGSTAPVIYTFRLAHH